MHKLFKIWFAGIHLKQSCIIIFFLSFSCNSSEPFAQNLIYTDTSSHRGLFVDGRLAGSSCLVGCAGVGPPRTSWQPCLRRPCARSLACLLSSGMIHVEQKHHSTQSLDPRPGAICKTLQSNTRASYDPRQGASARKSIPRASIRGEINLSHSIRKWQWHKKDARGKFIGHEIVRQIVARKDNKHPSKITRIQFIYWQSTLAGGLLTAIVTGSECIHMQRQDEQTNIRRYTKQISIQNVSSFPLWWTIVQRFGV